MDIRKTNKKICSEVNPTTQVVVDVIDTGVEPIGILKGRVKTVEYRGASTSDGKMVYGGRPSYVDNYGHGTAVAYVVCSHAPNAVIHSYCAMPYERDGSRASLIGNPVSEALEAIIEQVKTDNHRHIVNMSLGADTTPDSVYATRMHKAIKTLVELNVPVVVSAGNDGREILNSKYPSCFHEPFCISAVNNDGGTSNFSTWHNEVDFCDVGVSVDTIDLNGNKTTMSGTSFSAPCVTAKLAVMLGVNPNLTEQELYEAAVANAQDMSEEGFDSRTGWGYIASVKVASTSDTKAEDKVKEGDTVSKSGKITAQQLVAEFEKFLAEGRGYVYGAQGELYTQELAEKWHARAKSGARNVPSGRNKNSYFIGDCSKWIGKYVDDCSGGIVDAIRQYNPNYADRSANGFKSGFVNSGTIKTLPEKPGVALWYSGHIGVYVGNGYAIEFRGTDYGCVKTKVSDRKWTHWGEIAGVTYTAEETPTTPEEPTPVTGDVYYGVCTGGSVNVRTGPSTEYAKLGVAHKDDKLLVLPGDDWSQIAVVLNGQLVNGYMSNKYIKSI